MIARIGRLLSAAFAKTTPDPFVLAVLLTVATALLALFFGPFPGTDPDAGKLAKVIDAWRGPDGLWKFLSFGMQMCLILVTGHALAESRPVRAVVRRLASAPGSAGGAAAMIGAVAMVFGLMNWGLGLIVGALLARDTARALEDKGVRAHGPLLAAAGYTGLLVWHGGLSGSAPIYMTRAEQARAVLPAETIARLGDNIAITLDRTVFSTMNLFVTGGVLLIVPALLYLLTPRRDQDITPMPAEEDLFEDPVLPIRSLPDFLERSPVIPWTLGVLIAWALFRFAAAGEADQPRWQAALSIGPNEINMAMLALGLIAHGSVRSYLSSAERGARGCAGIILQFPLYAGIMGMLATSGLIASFSDWMASAATPHTLPVMTFLSAGVVNLFVPSGGGQWAIQGPVALGAGQTLGVAPEKMVMAVAYGDQLTNMLQPFWALPLLAITGVKARDIMGYTAVLMAVAGVWMALGLMLF